MVEHKAAEESAGVEATAVEETNSEDVVAGPPQPLRTIAAAITAKMSFLTGWFCLITSDVPFQMTDFER